MSKPRLFGGEIGSIGMSRSIGDRKAARACVSTPDVRTVRIAKGELVRLVIASDGVWDVMEGERAMAAALYGGEQGDRAVSSADSALRLCTAAHALRLRGRVPPDDITVAVVDVHGGPLALPAGALVMICCDPALCFD